MSNDVRHRFSVGECRPWFLLAERLNRAAVKHATTNRNLAVDGENGTTTLLVHLLFFRLLTNFEGSVLLADRGLIVEARALARLAGESALCILGAKFDPDHWRALVDDELVSRRQRAKLVVAHPEWGLDADRMERLAEAIEEMSEVRGLSKLDYKKIAQRSDTVLHYVLYRQLSADATHVSLESLWRYVNEGPDGKIASVQPFAKVTPEAITETLDTVCNFFFLGHSVFHGFTVDPGGTLDTEVGRCWEQYKVLTAARTGGDAFVPHLPR